MLSLQENLLEIHDQRLDHERLQAAVTKTVLIVWPEEVGRPDDGQVPRGHPCDLVMVREVTQVLEQVTKCGEVVTREQVNKVMQVSRLLDRWELGDAEEGLVQVVSEHRLRQGPEVHLEHKIIGHEGVVMNQSCVWGPPGI